MRRMLHFLFPLLALVVCVARPSRAEAPELVVCKDGQCVIAEKDWKDLQVLMSRMLYAAQQAQLEADHAEHVVESCKAFLKEHRG